jgi:prepilin-type N-terminal cleavage/methylation domain-containing protein
MPNTIIPRGQSKRNSGFTLIELLIVIGIIAILAALLFPVFASAKKAAKTTSTVSNQRQLGVAFTLYEDDNDDLYPLVCDGPLGENKTGGWVWYDHFNFNSAGHFDVTKGSIFPYAKNAQIYLSPNDGHANQTGLSFAINSCLVDPLSGTGLTPTKPTTAVPQPSDTMLLGEEGTGLGNDHSNDTNDGFFASLYDHFSAWNAGGTAIIFTDLHAKVRQVQGDAAIASVTSGNTPGFCN